MKKPSLRRAARPLLCGLALSLTLCLPPARGVPLPADAALPLGSSTTRGFLVRTVQAPVDAVLANSYLRAARQLAGILDDGAGGTLPNEALPGTGADGAHTVPLVNFEKDAIPTDVIDGAGTVLASYAPDLFPGIPGSGFHTDNFATEVVCWLELTAGDHVFGISSATDRTDVNDDDSWQLFAGKNPRELLNTKVAEFSRNVPAFQGNTHGETQFTLTAPVAGLYPLRLVHWQTTRGANLQFYSVETTGERLLVNDPADSRARKAWSDSSVAASTAPHLAFVSPPAGSAGNDSSLPIEAWLGDGTTTVVPATVKLYMNNVLLTDAVVTKTGRQTRVFHEPDSARTNPANAMRLEYQDSGGSSHAVAWSFTINVVGGSSTVVTGQWDFDAGNLAATTGTDLAYFDGPAGLTASGTRFGTTGELGLPGIGGREARVMEVPGDVVRQIGYVMTHGISPNGGGTRVNQFTLVMDIMVDAGSGAAALLQVNSLDNTDDGDLFWQGNNFGQGNGGYNGTGAFTPGEWHRVVAAYDMAANPPVVTKYVDCIKQDDWTANQGLDADRRALKPTAILFADGDQDERRKMWVNSIQIRSGKLRDAEIIALGPPSADGIPQVIPATDVTGQWDFNQASLAASVGKALQYLDGPGGLTESGTQFGTCTELGQPLINGIDARIMRVPGDVIRQIGYVMDHGIAPNGGGSRVNQFTLLFDILVAPGGGAASLLQVNSLDNTDDGDLFWQGNNFGQGNGGYNGTGAFTPGEWHRVIAAYDMAASPPVVTKYVDGIKQDDWTANQGLDADRRALKPTAILFADGDEDERREMWVDSIQIRSGKLTDAEMEALGGPSGLGLPVIVPDGSAPPPVLSAVLAPPGSVTLTWTVPPGHVLPPRLESSFSLEDQSWQPVETTGASATVPLDEPQMFFRLRY